MFESVDEPTGWVSPVVIFNKSDGNIRLRVNITEPNKSINRIHHVIPTTKDIRYQLNGAKYFSKLDLYKGYDQLELDPKSRNITTFSTHKGLARFQRFTLGCKSATEIFNKTLQKALIGVKGVLNIHDDILIFSENKEDHDKFLVETRKF